MKTIRQRTLLFATTSLLNLLPFAAIASNSDVRNLREFVIENDRPAEVSYALKKLGDEPFQEIALSLLDRWDLELRAAESDRPVAWQLIMEIGAILAKTHVADYWPRFLAQISTTKQWLAQSPPLVETSMAQVYLQQLTRWEQITPRAESLPSLLTYPDQGFNERFFLEGFHEDTGPNLTTLGGENFITDYIQDFMKHRARTLSSGLLVPHSTHELAGVPLATQEQKIRLVLATDIIGQKEVIEEITQTLIQDAILPRQKPEVFYLLGDGNGKDTIVNALASFFYPDRYGNISHQHLHRLDVISTPQEAATAQGSPTGYYGSNEISPLNRFIAENSGGRYLIEKVPSTNEGRDVWRIITNPQWQGKNLPGFAPPEKAILLVDNFDDWGLEAKDIIFKNAIGKGLFQIRSPNGGESVLVSNLNIILASKEAQQLVSTKNALGQRRGRPLTYQQSVELWGTNHRKKQKIRREIRKTNFQPHSNVRRGISDGLLELIPDQRLLLLEPLSPQQLQQIAHHKLQQLAQNLAQYESRFHHLRLYWDHAVVVFLQEYYYLPESNARPLENKLLNLIQNGLNRFLTDHEEELGPHLQLHLNVEQNADETWDLLVDMRSAAGDPLQAYRYLINGTLRDQFSGQMHEQQLEKLLGIEAKIKQQIFGQDSVVSQVAKSLIVNQEGQSSVRTLADATFRATSFMFLGPSSVGKTQLAKVLAQELYDDSERMKIIDFSKVRSLRDMKDKIFGSRDEYGVVTESEFMIHYDRYDGKIIIVLDEIANADRNDLKALYDVLDEPIVTFADGEERIMSNVIIIMTGNAGEEWYHDLPEGLSDNIHRMARDEIYQEMMNNPQARRNSILKYFSEAFVNRVGLGHIFFFSSLNFAAQRQLLVAKMQQSLAKLTSQTTRTGYTVLFPNEIDALKVVEAIEDPAFNIDEQGRSLEHYANIHFYENLKFALLTRRIPYQSKVYLRLDQDATAKNADSVVLSVLDAQGEKLFDHLVPKKVGNFQMDYRDTDKATTAFHEAGHEINKSVYFHDLRVTEKLSIMDGVLRQKSRFLFFSGIARSRQHTVARETYGLLIREMAELFGGMIAEELITDGKHLSAGVGNDLQNATDLIAKNAVLKYGLSERWNKKYGHLAFAATKDLLAIEQTLTEDMKKLLTSEIRRMSQQAQKLARKALLMNMDTFLQLGALLAEKGVLLRPDLEEFYRKHPLITESQWQTQPFSWPRSWKGSALRARWNRMRKHFTIDAVNSRDVQLLPNIPRPAKVANMNSLLKERREKSLAPIDDHRRLPIAPLFPFPEGSTTCQQNALRLDSALHL